MRITLAGDRLTASATSRTLGGVVVRYGVPGHTSKGKLRVRPGVLKFPEDLGQVKLTREHERDNSRGHLTMVDDNPERMRIAARASDGPEGDDALREAQDRTRDGLSFDIVDAVIEGDEIVAGRVVAIGQVGIPAYEDGRIDTIAAANTTPGERMNEQQRARLAELAAKNARTAEEDTEYSELAALAVAEAVAPAEDPEAPAAPTPTDAVAASAQPAQVAASMPAVPSGLPRPGARTAARPATTFRDVVNAVTAALQHKKEGTGNPVAEITAALTDVIHGDHTENIEAPAWSGELWSGLQYVPEWSDLFSTGPLTNWEGRGWRFVTTPEMQDYAGDKAAIPSGTVVTEDSSYEAARMAVGVDVDRKFYDFPNAGFVAGLFERIRESWEIKLDAKVRAYALAQAVPATRPLSVTTVSGDATVEAANGSFGAHDVGATITGTGIPAATTILSVTDSNTIELSANATASGTVTATIGAQAPTLLKAAARLSMFQKRSRVGKSTFVVANDEDMFTLLDTAEKDVSAFLDLWGINPGDFRSSPDVPAGTVIAGVKQAAVVRTLPGSPIRVSAQNIANGGVDEAAFGYWAIEEHHGSGIAKVVFKRAV